MEPAFFIVVNGVFIPPVQIRCKPCYSRNLQNVTEPCIGWQYRYPKHILQEEQESL